MPNPNPALTEVDQIDKRLCEIKQLANSLQAEKTQLEQRKYSLMADQDCTVTYQVEDWLIGQTNFYLTAGERKVKLISSILAGCDSPKLEGMDGSRIPDKYTAAYMNAWREAKSTFQQRKAEEQKDLERVFSFVGQQASIAADIPAENRKAFIKTLERKYHPDNGGDQELFLDVIKVRKLLQV